MEDTQQLITNFLNSPDASEYNPLTYLINPSEKTAIPFIYKNTQCSYLFNPQKKLIIDIFGPSGAGKDTLTRTAEFADVTIATSRAKREGESEGAYIWMRQKREDESKKNYYDALISEYGLFSYAIENDMLYGVPKSGFDQVKNRDVITIRMSARSITMLRENLAETHNIISLMVVPDSFESLMPSIIKRGNGERRLIDAVENMKLGKRYANYFLLNSYNNSSQTDIQSNIEERKKSFIDFVYSLNSTSKKK